MIIRIKKAITAVLSAMVIFSAIGCESGAEQTNSDDTPHGRLSPAEGVIEDTADEEGETVTTFAEPDSDEFIYTYVTATTTAGASQPAETTTPAATLPAGASQPAPEDLPTDGKVLVCYGFNEEFKNNMDVYYLADRPLSDIEVNWIITPGTTDYQYKLEGALAADAYAPADDKIDLFLAESNYVLRYVDTPYALPITALGITENELANQYPYTQALAKGSDGVIRASSYIATPEVIAYRRSIAETVLGVSEPEDVKPYLQNMAAFDETAGKMAEKGYKMVAAYDSLYCNYVNTADSPIVRIGTGKITIPDAWTKWVDDTKIYTEKGYNKKIPCFPEYWDVDMTDDDVFCYQGAPWFINYTLTPTAMPLYGDWAVVPGPVNTYEGGTFLLAGANTDNADIVADIMRYFTTDRATMEKFAYGTGTYVNNTAVNKSMGSDELYNSDFFGGQNPYNTYDEAANNINAAVVTLAQSKYAALSEYYKDAFTPYFSGTATKEECLEDFYNKTYDNYPELD
jgi:hypothetical protein